MSCSVVTVEAGENPCFDKKILIVLEKLFTKEAGMLKNSWIVSFLWPVLAVCNYRNGVVLRLQPVSQFHESGGFFQQIALFVHMAVFKISRHLLTFFSFYRERKIRRQGENLKGSNP
ncbi:MAG: hypothetical protein WC829_15665 [Hyphomicrobium sp.]